MGYKVCCARVYASHVYMHTGEIKTCLHACCMICMCLCKVQTADSGTTNRFVKRPSHRCRLQVTNYTLQSSYAYLKCLQRARICCLLCRIYFGCEMMGTDVHSNALPSICGADIAACGGFAHAPVTESAPTPEPAPWTFAVLVAEPIGA